MRMISVSEEPFNPGDILSRFQADVDDAGGIVSFTGKVRRENDVEELFLDHFPGATEASIFSIVEMAEKRWPISDWRIIHRVGAMKPGDAIVFVAVAAAHRRPAFEAADYIMDYLKTGAMFWKKETRATGSNWIEPKDRDYHDADRWQR